MNDSQKVFPVNQTVKLAEHGQRENPNDRSKDSDTTIDTALKEISASDDDSEVTLGETQTD